MITTQTLKISLAAFLMAFVAACGKSDSGYPEAGESYRSDATGASGDDNGTGDGQHRPGVITAGEWNDLNNWDFWQNILAHEDYKDKAEYWQFHTHNRISVQITSNGTTPIVDAVVRLKRGGTTLFTARSDNRGQAELYVDFRQKTTAVDWSKLVLDINNGAKTLETVVPYHQGINKVTLPAGNTSNKVDICFVVDATGSMSDELEYLKTELVDVLSRAKRANPNTDMATASVFYRDQGDEYVTRVSAFTNDYYRTIDFIKRQRADGGGDYPEAVHTALEKSINDLQWSSAARTRLLFLLLDAPPHHQQRVIQSLQNQMQKASEKGIKIIPIAASGVDKNTEFLMRFFSVSTNGTYIFITDDSGIGNSHLEPSVGEYQVEFLNDLMVRLINKYTE